MAGENCTLSAGGYGQMKVICEGLSYGIVFNTKEQTTRNARAFYFNRVDDDAFSIGIALNTLDANDAFSAWITGYMEAYADENNFDVQLMLVEVTSIDGSVTFSQHGMPIRVSYGGAFDDYLFHIALQFQGGANPLETSALDLNALLNTSSFTPGAEDGKADFTDSQYFYPVGTPADTTLPNSGTSFGDPTATTGFASGVLGP